MIAKLLALCVLAAIVTQGHAITQITLADRTVTFVTNPLIPLTISIPKHFLDPLETCHIIFPNGVMYEVFPNNNMPDNGYMYFLEAVQPFTSCAVGFRGAPISASGTYELLSLVQHVSDESRSLTRQRYHLTLVESES